jgi:hypothetical protein
MNTSKLTAGGKLVLHMLVNLAGNAALISVLPSLFPATITAAIFLVFNLAQVVYAFTDPSFAIHLIQTGQMTVPPVPPKAN